MEVREVWPRKGEERLGDRSHRIATYAGVVFEGIEVGHSDRGRAELTMDILS